MSTIHNLLRKSLSGIILVLLPVSGMAASGESVVCFSPESLTEKAVKEYAACSDAYMHVVPDTLTICTTAAQASADPRILYLLSRIYIEGKHMAPNIGRHISMLKKASVAHLADADADLADIILNAYLQQENKNESTGRQAIAYLDRAVACGSEKALFRRAEISMHDDFKKLGIHDHDSGNAELKKLLLNGNPYAMVYGAMWLLHAEKPADSGMNVTPEKKSGHQLSFFDFLTGEYSKNPDYPLSLLEKAADRGIKEAYKALAEEYASSADGETRLRGLAYARAAAECRGLTTDSLVKSYLNMPDIEESAAEAAVKSGKEIADTRGCH